MRFGCCAGPEHAALLSETGFDFVEWAVAGALQPELPDSEVLPELQEKLAGLKLTPEAFNVFLPGDLKVVGPDIDEAREARYAQSAFVRAAQVGGKIVVFGSGRSRNIPDGFSREEARRQIIAFLSLCGPIAAAQDVVIAIEPLNTGECNIINSVAEGMEFVRAVGHPAVRVLSDLYHVDLEKQSHSETRDAGAMLAHVHVAGRENRRAPNTDDIEYLAPYFRVLKEMGYAGRISVEGGFTDIQTQAAEALDAMRRAWEIA